MKQKRKYHSFYKKFQNRQNSTCCLAIQTGMKELKQLACDFFHSFYWRDASEERKKTSDPHPISCKYANN